MKVWITKYALTNGIFEVDGSISEDCPDMVCGPGHLDFYHKEGRDWHRTYEAAVKRAEAMRIAKIKSLEASIKKMKSLKF